MIAVAVERVAKHNSGMAAPSLAAPLVGFLPYIAWRPERAPTLAPRALPDHPRLMPIEFACSSCQQTVRVSDAAAGKKGKCPKCGSIMDIPVAGSAASAAPARPQPASSPARPAAAAAAPKPAANSAAKPALKPPAPPAPQPVAKVSGNNISFTCPSCAKPIVAPAALAGKKGKCPHCQAKVVIGGAGPPATDGLELLGPDDLAPLGPADLSPLGSSGLAPIGGGTGDLFGDFPPLAPAANSPFGGQPLPGAPLPSTPPLNPLGGAPSPYGAPSPHSNPFAAPSPFGASPYGASPYGASPYGASPYGGAMQTHSRGGGAPATLMIPAIGMIVVSGISLLGVCYLLVSVAVAAFQVDVAAQAPNAEQAQIAQGVFYGMLALYSVCLLIGLVLNGVVIHGAVQMIRLRSWRAAKLGAGFAVVPCYTLCLSMPLGIWALVVLNQPEVKRLFRD